MRKPRPYEKVCDCDAYSYPHRLFGGACNGLSIVEEQYANNTFEACDTCTCNAGYCEVLLGQENVKNAPCIQEFSRFEGVRLPIKWQPNRLNHYIRD